MNDENVASGIIYSRGVVLKLTKLANSPLHRLRYKTGLHTAVVEQLFNTMQDKDEKSRFKT